MSAPASSSAPSTPQSPTAGDEDLLDRRAVTPAPPLLRWLGQSGTWVLILDLVLVAVFTVLSPDHVFFSLENLQSLLLSGTETLLMALGIALLLGAGAIDLSVGANLVLSSVVGSIVLVTLAPVSLALAIGACLVVCFAVGSLFGIVNGIVIAYFDVNSLIATLGTTGVGAGTALLLTNGSDIGGLPTQLQSGFGLNTVAAIPIPALIAVVLTVAAWFVLTHTRYGSRTIAIGSLRLAAERAGIRVKPHMVSLTIVAGMLAGLAGFVDISHFGATTITGHANDALAAVTAVVIGGTRLEGGRVTIAGTVWGTALSVILQGGLVIIGVTAFWQQVAVGVVLIAAICLDRFRFRRRADR